MTLPSLICGHSKLRIQSRQVASLISLLQLNPQTNLWGPLDPHPPGTPLLRPFPILVNSGRPDGESNATTSSSAALLGQLSAWIGADGVEMTFPSTPGSVQEVRSWKYQCPQPGCATPSQCHTFYGCVAQVLGDSTAAFVDCLATKVFNDSNLPQPFVSCLLQVGPRRNQIACDAPSLK